MATEPTITDAFSALTMSSREIADLTGKRHDNVIRDIEKMLEETGMGLLSFEDTYRNEQNGQEYRCFNLPKNLTITLIAGYRSDLRLKIIDRWMALEAAASAPIASHDFYVPQTKAEALRLAADLTEQVERQKAEIEASKPIIEAHARIAGADGSLNVTEAAKSLQMKPANLFSWLSCNGWIYKRPGSANWLGYQSRTNAGDLTHKVTTVLRSDGSEKITEQVRVTPNGLGKLARLIPGRPSLATDPA